MTTASDYNGWTNWATWQINLWIDNEEPFYRAKQRLLRRISGDDSTESYEWVVEFIENIFPEGTPDMDPNDMKDVNWDELVESFVNESKEYT